MRCWHILCCSPNKHKTLHCILIPMQYSLNHCFPSSMCVWVHTTHTFYKEFTLIVNRIVLILLQSSIPKSKGEKGWRKLVIDSAPTTFKDQCCVLCIYCLKSHYSYSCQFQFVVEQTKVWTLFLSLINCRALGEWTVKTGSSLHWGENVICVKSWYTLIADPGSW